MNSLNKGWSFTAFFLLALAAQMLFFSTRTAAQTEVPAVKVELAWCVRYDYDKSRYVFNNRADLEATFYSADDYKKVCGEAAKSVDFDKYTLIGIGFQNSECHGFALEHKVIKDDTARLYRFQVTHPRLGSPCAGLNIHELWVRVPKLPEGYNVAFEVSQRKTPEEKEYGDEIRFSDLDDITLAPRPCLQIDDRVYNDESLKNLLSFEQCRKMLEAEKVDLKKQTLIGWKARGDCHMAVEIRLYRDDEKKLFTLLVKNRYGGCRAAGWREGMLTLPKIPDDYNVKFVEYKMDFNSENFRDDFEKHQVWSADGQHLNPRPNISPLYPEPTPGPAPTSTWSPGGNATVMERASSQPAAAAKTSLDEIALKILRKTGSNFYKCYSDKGGIYTEAEYQALLANKECTAPQELKVDLKKESLIGFGASGDCHVGAQAKVFRNDKTKTYTIAVNRIYRNCHANGQIRVWIVIKKMRPEYRVKWTYTKTEMDGVAIADDSDEHSPAQTLETAEIQLNGCIQMYQQNQFIINETAALLKAIRTDASNDRCVKDLKGKIDFSRSSLLGIDIDSGYCRVPVGLTHKAVRDDQKKLVTLEIGYLGPGGICRAVSSYHLWVTVPKIPDGYEVKFEVKPKPRTEDR